MNIKIICHTVNCVNAEIVFIVNEVVDAYGCGACGQIITDIIIEE